VDVLQCLIKGDNMGKIGFTTSIPMELIIAAKKIPLDLNNIFITDPKPQALVEIAEEAGYPRTACGWIKGMYAVALIEDLEALIAVLHGDCSNTQALMETLQLKGLNIIPSAVTHPLLLPFRNEGTRSSTMAEQSTLVSPVSIKTEPSGCFRNPGIIRTGRISSFNLPEGLFIKLHSSSGLSLSFF
jgi:hypothetical protein